MLFWEHSITEIIDLQIHILSVDRPWVSDSRLGMISIIEDVLSGQFSAESECEQSMKMLTRLILKPKTNVHLLELLWRSENRSTEAVLFHDTQSKQYFLQYFILFNKSV